MPEPVRPANGWLWLAAAVLLALSFVMAWIARHDYAGPRPASAAILLVGAGLCAMWAVTDRLD